jgi:CTD kinase subunit beta
MIYYQRYFLHHKFDTGIYHDIATTCLFVASKNEDTIKKLRDIIAVSVQVRNVFFSPEQLESYRKRILGLEFKLLETISFDFRAYHVEEYLVKFSKTLRIPKDAAYLAWLLAYDSYQLDIALKAPPSAIAVALLEIAAKLEGANANIHYREIFVNMEAVNETKLDMLDFYINSYNFTIMATLRPDLKNSFMEMKIPMANAKVIIERDPKSIEEDAYFEERFYSSGERRYMLGNQKKRLYSEIQ